MNIKTEKHDTLVSVFRSIIRAAGGFGTAVDIAAEKAATAAGMWFDGRDREMRKIMPVYISEIRTAFRSKEKIRLHTVEESPVTAQEVRPFHNHSTKNTTAQSTGDLKKYLVNVLCEGNVFATTHVCAINNVLSNLLNYVINVTSKGEEK